MKFNKLIITAILIFSFEASSFAQLDDVINLLSKKSFSFPGHDQRKGLLTEKTGNLQYDSIIAAQYKTTSDYNYYLLDSLASDQQLVDLTSHDSTVIQAYAAMALGSRDTLLLPGVLQKMLDAGRFVKCGRGCASPDEITGTMLLYGLRIKKRRSGFPSDAFMNRMDSIYLSSKNVPFADIAMELLRFKPISLNPVIETLAFERNNFSAIQYLHSWYKGNYYERLNTLCLKLLDSNVLIYSDPATYSLINILINLKDKKTLSKLGGWLKNNREKWVGLRGIDELLDQSFEVQDSIDWGQDRYPINEHEADFLLGDWAIISGMNINELKTRDMIILERKANQKGNYQKLIFDLVNDRLSLLYYQNIADPRNKLKMAGSSVFDSKNTRICIETGNWNWYKIIKKGNRLFLIRDN